MPIKAKDCQHELSLIIEIIKNISISDLNRWLNGFINYEKNSKTPLAQSLRDYV